MANAGIVEDIVDGPGFALGQSVLVAPDGGVPAGADVGFEAEEPTYTAVERLVKGVAEAAAGVVERA